MMSDANKEIVLVKLDFWFMKYETYYRRCVGKHWDMRIVGSPVQRLFGSFTPSIIPFCLQISFPRFS